MALPAFGGWEVNQWCMAVVFITEVAAVVSTTCTCLLRALGPVGNDQ
jgi:hypothetical protein